MLASRGLGASSMSRPLTLWGIIESDGRRALHRSRGRCRRHPPDRTTRAGRGRAGPQPRPGGASLRGLHADAYARSAAGVLHVVAQLPGGGSGVPRKRARSWDRHRPVLVGPHRGEPSIGSFAAAHPEYRARTADGADTLGYCDRLCLSPAFPEVRARQAAEIAQALTDTGAEGVQVEFVNGMEDAGGLVPAGYEERTVGRVPAKRRDGTPTRFSPDDPGVAGVPGRLRGPRCSPRRASGSKAISKQAVFSATIIASEPERSLHGLHDWAAWTERGVIDELYLWFRTESDPDAVRAARRPRGAGGSRTHPAVRRALLLPRGQLPGTGPVAGGSAARAGGRRGRRRGVPAPRGRPARPVGHAGHDRPPVGVPQPCHGVTERFSGIYNPHTLPSRAVRPEKYRTRSDDEKAIDSHARIAAAADRRSVRSRRGGDGGRRRADAHHLGRWWAAPASARTR